MSKGINPRFNGKLSEPADEMNMWVSYRQTSNGAWLIEWRYRENSPKPFAIRKARDVEVTFIEHIVRLEECLINPNAPRPMKGLIRLEQKLRPWRPARIM